MRYIRTLPNSRNDKPGRRSHLLRWILLLAVFAAASGIVYEQYADKSPPVGKPHPPEPQLHSDPLTFMFGGAH